MGFTLLSSSNTTYQIFDVTDGCGEPEILEGGRAGCTFFFVSLTDADAFSARNSAELAHEHFSKPERRCSSRGLVNCAGVPANVMLEVTLIAPKQKLKLYSFN